MNLSQKIELLIQRKQISSSQFADKIGIPRSSVSHILSGRNKPSLDVVQKILKAFPELTAEELLFDDRLLSLNSSPTSKIEVTNSNPSLFDAPEASPSESDKNSLAEPTIVQSNLRRNRESAKISPSSGNSSMAVANQAASSTHLTKRIERVIIFYTDGSFTESKPSE
ncbi:helix-turn-helix transcriptional regulator [Aquirufa nivalisilvae]|uniref:helix-turn-helix transcriptional regulator n=1 Tax=Aquirufa nivalisilvae TaxID=2516557 RepID=UPI001032AF2B|nr:helix-turn-helix transcriptional regulator [Aquirufa nivalisilvae]TBH73946.1 XRE family transcriptional regulator [Aquirufa nivalisilvae]